MLRCCRWVDDFSQLQLGRHEPGQWARDFAAEQQNYRAQSWNQIWDESSGQTNQWATEFDQSQSATVGLTWSDSAVTPNSTDSEE